MSSTASAAQAELRIPGTPVHVHVSAVSQPRLNEIITLGAALNFHQTPEIPATLAGLQALGRLVSVLKTEYGERSVAEALAQAKPATAEVVVGELHGVACRHPKVACRYASDSHCAITKAAVESTLKDLQRRGIVKALNAVEPVEYSVTF